jgi:hypothetical protein
MKWKRYNMVRYQGRKGICLADAFEHVHNVVEKPDVEDRECELDVSEMARAFAVRAIAGSALPELVCGSLKKKFIDLRAQSFVKYGNKSLAL